MSNVIEYNHPLILHKLGIMRQKTTCPKEFRELLQEISLLMGFELTRDIPTENYTVETPLETTECKRITGQNIVIIPVLRAGMGMSDGLHKLIPTASIGHLGLQRNHQTLQPELYYCHLPPNIESSYVIITDPMLATGGSLIATIDILKSKGCKELKIMSLIAAPEGIKRIHAVHPDVKIYVAQIDRQLDERGYIMPGLGDAGDRIYSTIK